MEDNKLNLMDVLSQFNETYEDAVKKNTEESQSFSKTKYFRIDSVGQYPVRILPIVPTQDPETGEWKLDRKGYEYPIKTNILCLVNPAPKSKKDAKIYVPIIQATYAGISTDLVDTYIKVAGDKYGDDENLMEKIKASSFNGGLKWSSQRAMYIFDMNKRSEGLQVLMLSYSQYKGLEDLKLQTWKDLVEQNPQAPCPISSPFNAYPVTITRKEENKNTSYSFNINVLKGVDKMSEEEMKALFDAPRLPEALYRYSRYHLEATIEFLKQYDSKMDLDIMKSKEIVDTIEKIKMELPSDDTSHFSFKSDDKEDKGKEVDINDLWDEYDALVEDGKDDKSAEGQNLRERIGNYIDDHDLDVRISRRKSNKDLLEDIDDAIEAMKSRDDVTAHTPEEEKVEKQKTEEPEEVEAEEPVEAEEVEESVERHSRGEHNDDTNEPARRPREARGARRRVR